MDVGGGGVGRTTYPVVYHLLAKYSSLVLECTRPNSVATSLGKEDGNREVGSSGLKVGVTRCLVVHIATPFVAVQGEEIDAI